MLSLLSTTIGPEHEPLLPRGVVNPWKTKSGTQCWAHGQWIGHFIYQCDAELLHNMTSHPAIREHHQLVYVGWQAADTNGHTEIGFFWQENSSKCMTFSKWLTGQHQAVHDPITNFTSARVHVLEDSAQMPLWDTMIHDMKTHSIPRGNMEHWKTSPRRGGTNPIPRWSGYQTREVILECTHVGKQKLCSEHYIVPGAPNFLKVLGALDFLKVPGEIMSHSTMGQGVGSDQVRKAFHFSCCYPTPDQSWGIIV